LPPPRKLQTVKRQTGEQGHKQSVVPQCQPHIPVQQRMQRPRRPAAGTIPSRQRMENAGGIKTVRAGLKKNTSAPRASPAAPTAPKRRHRGAEILGGTVVDATRMGGLKADGIPQKNQMARGQIEKQSPRSQHQTQGREHHPGQREAAAGLPLRVGADL